MRWLRRSLFAIALFAIALFAGACTSPTLPLPPPALPSISLGTEAGTFVLASDRGALPNALVVIVNRDTSLPSEDRVSGTIADAVGSWQVTLKGKVGDLVDVTQQDGTQASPTTTVELR